MPVRTDFECDTFHFYDSEMEDEFYDAPAPSEDIWKKFELVQTPPKTPEYEPFSDDSLGYPEGDEYLSKTLLFPELGPLITECCGNLKSKLIQDCMWSGKNSLPQLSGKPVVTDKKSASSNSNVSTKSANGTTLIGNMSESSIDCVDPSTIFPYPVNTQDKLGVMSPSDSEDDINDEDDDDEDDDDEEEIDVVGDVVTVGEQKETSSASRYQSVLHKHKSSSGSLTTTSMSAQVAAMHNYTQPHYSAPATPNPTGTLHHHSYHSTSLIGQKRSKASSSPSSPQPLAKKSKLNNSVDMRQVVRKLKINRHHSSKYHSSDSEDSSEGGKRAQHNVLERKRRNDLKFSFLRLRDNVPDLSGNDKAAKVVILRKATDYINNLSNKHEQLSENLDYEKKRNLMLKQKLAKLRSC